MGNRTTKYYLKEKKTVVIKKTVDNTVQYTTIFPKTTRLAGKVEFLFRKVGSYKQKEYFISNNIYRECTENYGLNEDDTITQMPLFYPNGHGISESQLKTIKNRLGKEMLEKVIEDSLLNSSKLLITNSTTPSMRTFCNRNNFSNEPRFPNTFYRLLG
ncbi:hypothetical protein ISS05_04160 [Candidatus Woesearchaeota archaeon]|nr:hypothetical protein [Candidatus Woesearchaeota archaeon]